MEFSKKGTKGGISNIPYRHADNCYFYDKKLGKTIKLDKENVKKNGIRNNQKYIIVIICMAGP